MKRLFYIKVSLRDTRGEARNATDESIDVFHEVDNDQENRCSNEESDHSKQVLSDEEDEERHEYWKLCIRRDDFRVEIIGLDSVHGGYHSGDRQDSRPRTDAIGNQENRYRREKGPEYRNESTEEYDESNREGIGKHVPIENDTDDRDTDDRQESVHCSDDALSLENETEGFRELSEYERKLFMQELE